MLKTLPGILRSPFRANFGNVRALELSLILLLTLLAKRSEAQYWICQFGTGTGFDNRVAHYTGSHSGAEMITPMWNIGVGRSFGDSTTHVEVDLEYEHQTWQEGYNGWGNGPVGTQQYRGTIVRKLGLLRAVPQIVFPLSGVIEVMAAADLGMVVNARTVEDGEWRGLFSTGPWSPSDTSYGGTTDLNIYQWSVRAAFKVTFSSRWFTSLSLAVGNSTYEPPTGRGDGLTPLFMRLAIGHRF